MSLVSVIIPYYRKKQYIYRTLKSVINQFYKKLEIIIIYDDDNLSDLNYLEKLFQSEEKIRIIKNSQTIGAGLSRNKGIQNSKGEYIAFIDADDIWKKYKLENQINFMKKNNFSFTYTNYETFGKKSKKINNPPKLDFSNFIKNTSIATSTMMIKREKIKNIKFTNSKICEDYYFKCRLLKKTKFAYCLKKNLTRYRIRDGSLQSNNFRNFYWIWKINKNFNNLNFFENLSSLFFISINSIKKYSGKNSLDIDIPYM